VKGIFILFQHILRGSMVIIQISGLISVDQTYSIELYKGSTSLIMVQSFALDVKGAERTWCLERRLGVSRCAFMCL